MVWKELALLEITPLSVVIETWNIIALYTNVENLECQADSGKA